MEKLEKAAGNRYTSVLDTVVRAKTIQKDMAVEANNNGTLKPKNVSQTIKELRHNK